MRPCLSLVVSLLPALQALAQKAATPAPGKPAAAIPATTLAPADRGTADLEAWLAKTDAQFRVPYEKDVLAPYEAGRQEVKQQYLAILVPQLTAAAAQARQADSDFLREERQRVFDGKGVPPTDADKPPAAIVPGRTAYRTQMAKLEQDRARTAKAHFDRFDKFLADTQITLAQRQRVEDVALLKAKREALAREWLPASLVPAQAAVSTTKATPAPRGPAADTSKAAVHETVEWLIEAGAEVFVLEGNKEVRIYDTKPLATSREGISKVMIASARLTKPIAPAEVKKLGAFKALRILEIRAIDLDDESIAFLQQLENLESLTIWYGNKLTDQTWDYLAAHPKLKTIKFHNAKALAGKTVDKLANERELRTLELENTGVGDEGAAAIAKLIQLDTLSLAKSKVTDAALPVLAKLPNLTALDLTGTPVTPRGLAALKGLRRLDHLGYLDAQMPALNEAIREIVANFPRLTTWKLSGDPITAEAIGALAQVRAVDRLILTGKVESGGLAALAKVPGLDKLLLINGDHADAGLEPLQALHGLKYLEVGGKGVTDQFLEKMKKNRGLKEIKLSSTSVTAQGIAAYEKQVPGSKVGR
jgi:hypothetical protein